METYYNLFETANLVGEPDENKIYRIIRYALPSYLTPKKGQFDGSGARSFMITEDDVALIKRVNDLNKDGYSLNIIREMLNKENPEKEDIIQKKKRIKTEREKGVDIKISKEIRDLIKLQCIIEQIAFDEYIEKVLIESIPYETKIAMAKRYEKERVNK